MQIVYHAEGIVDAHLVKDALERAEIPAFINGEYLIGGVGQLPARDFLSVSVPDGFAEPADTVVREISAMLAAPLADEQPADARPAEPADSGVPPLGLRPLPV